MKLDRNHPLALPLDECAQAWSAWFLREAMPLWSRAGVDHASGGFAEKLDAQGKMVEEPRRTRVVARQIYVFSVAAKLGWDGESDALVQHGLDFLHRRLLRNDQTFASGVRPDGTLVNATFDLYEQAFALFALASAYRLGLPKRQALLDQALLTLEALRAGWRHPVLGFEESNPPSIPLRSNPHMHLFEAALQWEAVLPAGARDTWAALADELAQLALQHLIDGPSGIVTELFDKHWRPLPGDDGTLAEPGHQFEWGWLLHRWGVLRQRADGCQAARKMIDLAEARGIDPRHGVAINAFGTDGQVRDGHAKLWPQTERVKAWTQIAACASDPQDRDGALAHVTLAMKGLLKYLHKPPVQGCWHEVMLADGSWSQEPTRTSSLYHVVCALETLHDSGIARMSA